MASERIQRRIDRLLDQAEEAMDQLKWDAVGEYAQAALGLDPGNTDALAYLDSAQLVQQTLAGGATPTNPTKATFTQTDQPTSFANGRYQVKQLLGEGVGEAVGILVTLAESSIRFFSPS